MTETTSEGMPEPLVGEFREKPADAVFRATLTQLEQKMPEPIQDIASLYPSLTETELAELREIEAFAYAHERETNAPTLPALDNEQNPNDTEVRRLITEHLGPSVSPEDLNDLVYCARSFDTFIGMHAVSDSFDVYERREHKASQGFVVKDNQFSRNIQTASISSGFSLGFNALRGSHPELAEEFSRNEGFLLDLYKPSKDHPTYQEMTNPQKLAVIRVVVDKFADALTSLVGPAAPDSPPRKVT